MCNPATERLKNSKAIGSRLSMVAWDDSQRTFSHLEFNRAPCMAWRSEACDGFLSRRHASRRSTPPLELT
jgi:hypothetical protein